MAESTRTLSPPVVRTLLTLAAFAGLGVFILAFFLGNGGSRDDEVLVSTNPAIDRLIPADGDEVPRQQRVGIDLAPGFAADLFLNGEAIPIDQLDVTTDDVVSFSPGGDKFITFLNTEENCAEAFYYLIAEPAARRSIEWCFTAG